MIVINARNVNSALAQGCELMKNAQREDSRNGPVLAWHTPVTTVYRHPQERVLFNANRDANPFFHVMEAMWILAGRQDVKFLTEFNKRMAEYSDDGEVFNAPYGYRLRNCCETDQLKAVIEILKKDPQSRQAICQIWDPIDLEKKTKDKACNMQLVFRVNGGTLDITVYNRSNDMIWGAYGANAVQFSFIQEYVAAHLGLKIGRYYQVSNNFHIYTSGPGGEAWKKVSENPGHVDFYGSGIELVTLTQSDVDFFERDLKMFFEQYDRGGLRACKDMYYVSNIFNFIIHPMLRVWISHKGNAETTALEICEEIRGEDWRIAAKEWLQRRYNKEGK